MTGLLEEALKRVESLPPESQDVIATRIIQSLDDEAEEAWLQTLRDRPGAMLAMAREAREEHRRGVTRPFDELVR